MGGNSPQTPLASLSTTCTRAFSSEGCADTNASRLPGAPPAIVSKACTNACTSAHAPLCPTSNRTDVNSFLAPGKDLEQQTAQPLDCQNQCDGFSEVISMAYEHVVHWKWSLFNIPYGSVGAKFVDELAPSIQSFADAPQSQHIAWKAVSVASHLLLQKPALDGSNSVYSQHLNRRLALWQSSRIADLFEESVCIQRHIPAYKDKKWMNPKGPSDTVFGSSFSRVRSTLP